MKSAYSSNHRSVLLTVSKAHIVNVCDLMKASSCLYIILPEFNSCGKSKGNSFVVSAAMRLVYAGPVAATTDTSAG